MLRDKFQALRQGMFAKLVMMAVVAAPAVSMAVDTSATDGAAAVTGLVAGQALYLPVFILLAIASVGIGIAVKWIKRAKGAA